MAELLNQRKLSLYDTKLLFMKIFTKWLGSLKFSYVFPVILRFEEMLYL